MEEPDDPEQTGEQPSEGDDPSSRRLTRKSVADRLGVSIFKIRSMEGKTLHPVRENGVHYFDAEEVERAVRLLRPGRRGRRERTEDEIAVLAFRAFEDGKDLREIVDELEVAPEKVRALYREWREPDLEEHEVKRRRRDRAEAERRHEDEEQRRHDQDMARWEKTFARLAGK